MSKAFTRDDGAGEPSVRRPPPPAFGPKRPMTPEGHAALKAELEKLVSERPANPQGTPARLELEERIAFVQAVLDTTVPTAPVAGERAYFGAWVELEDEDGARVTYRLVGPDEADAKASLISVEAPLGKAMLGREAGDEVVVRRPRGPATFNVLAVRYD